MHRQSMASWMFYWRNTALCNSPMLLVCNNACSLGFFGTIEYLEGCCTFKIPFLTICLFSTYEYSRSARRPAWTFELRVKWTIASHCSCRAWTMGHTFRCKGKQKSAASLCSMLWLQLLVILPFHSSYLLLEAQLKGPEYSNVTQML